MSEKHRKYKGMTLLEVLVVLAVLAILAGIATPVIFNVLEQQEIKATMDEMESVYNAIVGAPVNGNYGYIGHMGEPPDDLKDLNHDPCGGGCPYQSQPTTDVWYGWNGPYMKEGFEQDAYMSDEWGILYKFDKSTGQITSAGPNRNFGDSDDLTYPVEPEDNFGFRDFVDFDVVEWNGHTYQPPTFCRMTFYYCSPVTHQQTSTTKTSFNGKFRFNKVHWGMHGVYVRTLSRSKIERIVITRETSYIKIYVGGP